MIHTVNVRTKKDAIRHPLTLAYIWRNLTAPWQQFCFGQNMYIFKPPSYCFRVKRKIHVPQGTFHIALTTFHAQSVFHNPVRIYFIEKNDLLKASRLFCERSYILIEFFLEVQNQYSALLGTCVVVSHNSSANSSQ